MELNLNASTKRLFASLEKNTGIKKEELIANVVNGVDELEDLIDLNDCLNERRKNPHPEVYSHEEVRKMVGLKRR